LLRGLRGLRDAASSGPRSKSEGNTPEDDK
jgi:hypothetical protein